MGIKQIDTSFLCVCPLIDLKIKWRRKVVKVLWIHELQVSTGASLFFTMTKAWKSQFAGKNEKDTTKFITFLKLLTMLLSISFLAWWLAIEDKWRSVIG